MFVLRSSVNREQEIRLLIRGTWIRYVPLSEVVLAEAELASIKGKDLPGDGEQSGNGAKDMPHIEPLETPPTVGWVSTASLSSTNKRGIRVKRPDRYNW